MPTVSVVVPCYRYGRLVTDCVSSLLANTNVGLDILVVDDASPDDSWSVVERLPLLDPRIRVQRNEQNQGLIATANAGIMAAKGDYVVLISADDALAPGWLDRGVSFLEDNPRAALVYGRVRRFSGPVPRLRLKRRVRPAVHSGRDWIEQSCVRGVTPVSSPEAIVRTAAQHEVGGYRPDLPYSSDMDMWLRLASIGDVVHLDGAFAAFYRVHAQSMSRVVYGNMLKELEVRRDAFGAWYGFAEGRVPDRASLLAEAKRTLAKRAVRRAYLAFLQDPAGSQFRDLCAFAVDNDPDRAGPHVERLRSMAVRGWARQLRRPLLPLTNLGFRARLAITDIRARLHII
jgi:glycosyltransferase involved in cell wall biosynthesis